MLQGAAQGAAGGLPSQWQLCRAAAQREACRQKHARPLRLHTGAIHAFGPCPSHVGGTLPACPCQASPWAGTAAPRRSLTKLNGWLAVPMAVAYFIVAGGVWFVSMMTKDNLKRVEGVHGAQPSTHVSTVAAARVQSDVEAARSEAAAYRQEREAAARRQLKLRLEAAELRALEAFEAAKAQGGRRLTGAMNTGSSREPCLPGPPGVAGKRADGLERLIKATTSGQAVALPLPGVQHQACTLPAPCQTPGHPVDTPKLTCT